MASIKASTEGLKLIKAARERITGETGWAIDDPRWLEAASKFLPPVSFGGKLVPGTTSVGTWKRFLRGTPIKEATFRAFCQLLELDFDRVVSPTPDARIQDFYVSRNAIEAQCYKMLLQPDCMLRIKASQRMGKTSLVDRVLNRVAIEDRYKTVRVSFKLAERRDLANIDDLLEWICVEVGEQLELPPQFDRYWDEDVLNSKMNCTNYFERYLLTEIDAPLALCLDDVDLLFAYPNICADFFPLLRFWNEKRNPPWHKLRLAIVYSTQIYIELDIDRSPFNIGKLIELPELTLPEIKQLATLHDFDLEDDRISQLMQLLGGHPDRWRQAISELKSRTDLTLNEFIDSAPTDVGIYSTHLREQLYILQQNPILSEAFKQILLAQTPVKLDTLTLYKLESLGLVKRVRGEAIVSCDLYRLYFQSRLGEL